MVDFSGAGAGVRDSLGFDFTLKRSGRRRTLEVQVAGAAVTVLAPAAVSARVIYDFLAARKPWVLDKIHSQAHSQDRIGGHHFVAGSRWWFIGEPLDLQVYRGPHSQVSRDQHMLLVQLGHRVQRPEAAVKKLLVDWYQHEAACLLRPLADEYAARLGKVVRKIALKKLRSRWGHCTRDGGLLFNWLIMQAPRPVINYLVAHEVSHLRHFNHSPAFWAVVAELQPDYKLARAWLKEHGHALWF